MSYCLYFQAHVKKESVWIVTSILRSCEHLAFDRNIDLPKSIFEFFGIAVIALFLVTLGLVDKNDESSRYWYFFIGV